MRAVLLGALVVLVAGCTGGGGGKLDSPAGLVPWTSAKPTQLAAKPVKAAAPCRASNLRVVGAGLLFTPAVTGGTGRLTLRNAGAHACRLTGRPSVRAVGAVPSPRQDQEPLPPEPATFPDVIPPDTALLAVPKNGTATLDVAWRNWCVPVAKSATKPVPPRVILVTLPGGRGGVEVGYNAVPSCDSPHQPATIGVRPFQPSPLRVAKPWTSGTVQATIQSPHGAKAALSGKRGQVVTFVVVLHNASSLTVRFNRCPLVVEMLAPAGRLEVHQLNCRAAGSLAPGASRSFEMRIKIPADAPTGANGLFWELDPLGARGPEAVSRIMVAAH